MNKKILVINPNTSPQMTEEIKETILAVKNPFCDVEIIHPDFGPESLESARDYTVAGYAMLKKIENLTQKYDGVLIACFGDPCLYAIKEVFDCPVIGIAEASMSAAILLGYKFSLLGASKKSVPMFWNMVGQYGLQDRCADIESIDLGVSMADQNKDETKDRLKKACIVSAKKGAEVAILGCAGMTGLGDEIEKETNIIVLDPVKTGYKQLEMFVMSGIKISKSGLYSKPYNKNFSFL